MVTVATVTDDFTDEVINKRRDDEQVPLKLVNKNERNTAERARLGMEALEKKKVELHKPNAEMLGTSLNKVRAFYSEAYGWNADIG